MTKQLKPYPFVVAQIYLLMKDECINDIELGDKQ